MIELDTEDRELLAAEIERLSRPAAHDYQALAVAVSEGTIPDTLMPTLEHVVDAALAGEGAHRHHGPQEEQRLRRLFERMPRGKILQDNIKEINSALKALAGQRIAGLSFGLRTPGAYRLEMRTDRAELVIYLGAEGIRVHQVEVRV